MGKQFLIMLLTALTLWMVLPISPNAVAQTPPANPPSSPLTLCQQLRAQYPNAYIRPLVECIAGQQGFISVAVKQFLNSTLIKNYYRNFMLLVMTLAVTFYGVRLAMGGVEKPAVDTFTLLLKFGGVAYFMANAPSIYTDMTGIVAQLSDIVGKASDIVPTGFCSGASAAAYLHTSANLVTLWDRFDCIFRIMFSLAKGPTEILGIFALIMLIFFSSGIGFGIFFSALYFIASLIFTVARFIHIYLMAILGIGFMFCIGYLIVPLFLLDITYLSGYFKKWVTLVLGYMLTPVIMFAFMGMVLVGADLMIFSGHYSIWKQMGGPNADENMPSKLLGATKTSVQNLFYISFDPTAAGSSTQVDSGALGQVASYPMKGSDFEKNNAQGMSSLGFEKEELNFVVLAQQAGKPDVSTYLVDILLSCISAGIFIYIMFSLLSYIPDLAHDLASQDTSAGKIGKTEVAGQAAVLNTIQTLKDLSGGKIK